MRFSPLLFTFACAPQPPDLAPDGDLLASVEHQGRYSVGHATLQVDTTQLGSGSARSLPVEVWYPTEQPSNSTVAYSIAGLIQVPSALATSNPPSISGPVPVAIYSHGSGGEGAVGYAFGERLASHGWLVLAPDHVGNTAFDALGGGVTYIRSAIDRPLDVIAVLDAVEAGLDLELQPQTDEVLLFGHSFGGFTSLVTAGVEIDLDQLGGFCPPNSDDPECLLLESPELIGAVEDGLFSDPRIAAIVPQAPAALAFAEGSVTDLDLPVLLMSAGRDATLANRDHARPIWQELDGPEDRWLQIPDGGHYSFITLCEDADPAAISAFIDVESDGCGPDFVPPGEVVPALVSYVLAWGEWQVLGNDSYQAVFDAEPLHPGLQLQTK